MTLFFFFLYNGYSGTSLYDSVISGAYNVVWTSIPVLVLGMLDQDVRPLTAMDNPILYRPGQWKTEYNARKMVFWMLIGIGHGAAVYFFAAYAFMATTNFQNGMPGDFINFVGTIVANSLAIVVNLKVTLAFLSF
jgi:magnesium-transporting ATPase (P-type)